MLVKRILAMEGDIVKTLPPYPDREVHIPQGHVWVEGTSMNITLDLSESTDNVNR
jgi:inner membrane protease subunit 2